MTIELWMLLAGVATLFAGINFQAIMGLAANGFVRQLGPRDDAPALHTGYGRSERAVQNQIESLALFAPLVLVAHTIGVNTAMTEMGAVLYAASRAAYLPIYWLGIPAIRTLAFAGGLTGTLMIAFAIILA